MNRLPMEILENIVDELKTIYIITRIGKYNNQFYGIYDILAVVSSKQKAIDFCISEINSSNYKLIEKISHSLHGHMELSFYIIPNQYNDLYFGIFKTKITS